MCSVPNLLATNTATITYPTNNSEDVMLLPTFTIMTTSNSITTQHFDTTKITVGFPDCDTLIYPYNYTWRNAWFGAHKIKGLNIREFVNSPDNGVTSQFEVKLYKSEDSGNNAFFE